MNIPLNHQYLLSRIDSVCSLDGDILDYGCGKGVIVEHGLQQGLSIFGCELFGSGSGVRIREQLNQKGLLGGRVREIKDGAIPFPDEKFELIISNQVFEHIPPPRPCA